MISTDLLLVIFVAIGSINHLSDDAPSFLWKVVIVGTGYLATHLLIPATLPALKSFLSKLAGRILSRRKKPRSRR